MGWEDIVGNVGDNQYRERIQKLNSKGIVTTEIEQAVDSAVASFRDEGRKSFVIFGEPQSGKTEMMIALNARLLDEGCEVIINLLTDSVDLLNQSLSRFRRAGLSPSPKQFLELPHDPKVIAGKQWVIFSKKNAKDLEKLLEALRFVKKVVVIDDEADYATPNAKVNKEDERTKINHLIYKLIGKNGSYIGVTATPARLDLNNTFDNDAEKWVHFRPHREYVGQDFFFPSDGKVEYRLHQFPADEGNERAELRNAVLNFLCGVAEQHQRGVEENFSMIVHTSGKIDEHSEDVKVINDTLHILSDRNHRSFRKYCGLLEKVAPNYNSDDPGSIVDFVLRRINKNQVVVVNSKGNKSNVADLLNPTSLFSFGAGGNIISRGVTFENLLSMYFTRSVKGKFSQDTYIQRARMFGARNKYKEYFQLWIPAPLIESWGKCFSFHKLAVEAVIAGRGAPVWLSDHKTTPTAPGSIDKSTVDFEDGEMSWAIFDFDEEVHEQAMLRKSESDFDKLQGLRRLLSPDSFPDHVVSYLESEVRLGANFICFHPASEFGSKSKKYSAEDVQNIGRKKGIFSTNEFARGDRPDAKHHLKIFYNAYGRARLVYKINGTSIRFIQNRK